MSESERQGFHVLTAMRENIKRIEDDVGISTGILQCIEIGISVGIKAHQFTINHRAWRVGLQ